MHSSHQVPTTAASSLQGYNREMPAHLRMVIMEGQKMPTSTSKPQKASSCTLPSKVMPPGLCSGKGSRLRTA